MIRISSNALAAAALRAALVLGAAWLVPAVAQDAYVNPQTGNNATGVLGNPNQPYRTLWYAIDQIRTGPSGVGVVRAMPGIYCDDPTFNSEIFPLYLYSGISLQGIGAKECVIRRTRFDVGAHTDVLLPRNPPGVDNDDTVYPIVDLSRVGTTPVFVEGFTFQGGHVQVYTYPEAMQTVRISNCVFDLRIGGDEDLVGPEFGVLLTSVWDVVIEGYRPLNYHILNNTFVAGYQRSELSNDRDVSRPSCVALCNSNDPALWAGSPDPDPTVRGVSDLNVQNNLFRILPNQLAMAMLGVDSTDTKATIGSPPPPPGGVDTNAFDPADVGVVSKDAASKWTVQLDAGKSMPTAVLDIDVDPLPRVDPGFIGEMVGQTQSGWSFPRIRDWRLVHGSPLEGLGQRPRFVPPPTGPLVQIGALSGLVYSEHPAAPDRAFDWDGEGFGNARIADGAIEVGFDEIGDLVIAGSYGSDSKSHGSPFHPTITPGNTRRIYVARQGSIVSLYTSVRTYVPGVAWDLSPGTTPNGTPPTAGLPWYLASPYSSIAPAPWALSIWTNPLDGATHVSQQTQITFNDYGPPTPAPAHLNTQAVIADASGQRGSNLQFEIR